MDDFNTSGQAEAPSVINGTRPAQRKGYLWTTHEEAVLRKHYPTDGPDLCVQLLSRPRAAIYAKARTLGLTAPRAASTTLGLRFSKKYPQDEQTDNAIREGYIHATKRGDLARLADRVNRPRWWVSKRACELGLTMQKLRPNPWTKAELEILEHYASARLDVIARKLKAAGFNRTATAIAVQLKRHKIDRTDPDSWTANELGPLLGVHGATVCDWIERRGLKATKIPRGDRHTYRVTREQVRAWLKSGHQFIDLRRVNQPWFWDLLFGSVA